MQTLEELIDKEEPGWEIVFDWISRARNKIEILPKKEQRAEETLLQMQVTTRSLMGAIIYETGGILVDNGWIRLLGSGSDRMKRTLTSWNRGKTFGEYGETAPYLFIADDVIGGLYAINGGYLGDDKGDIYYFSPEYLEWVALEITYAEFLLFCFEGKLDEFYDVVRWNGWEDDVANLGGDYAYSFSPFLWTKEGKDINKASRQVLSIEEVYNFNLDMKEKLGIK